MDAELSYSFDYLEKDRLCARVSLYNNGKVIVDNYTDVVVDRPFGVKTNVDLQDLYEFFEYRCFPKTRVNADEILASMGLKSYNPVKIVRITHGCMVDDQFWIRFNDESDLTYDDVRLRF